MEELQGLFDSFLASKKQMRNNRCLETLLFIHFFSICYAFKPPVLGVHPLDEKYYSAKVIKCKDGSKYFTRDRLNDDFCDCLDGTDEPGTSACPAGKFYCRNVGSIPKFIFSSQVNDHICDCCDGSDEYDGSIGCPNSCIMGGNVEYKAENLVSKVGSFEVKTAESKGGINFEDLIEKLKGVKIVIMLQLFLLSFLLIFHFCWRGRSKRRRFH